MCVCGGSGRDGGGDGTNKWHIQITIFAATTSTATAKKQPYATNPVMLMTK